MISKIEAYNYRCFKKLGIGVGSYHVLAGANGSGKSTLLDIPLLIRDMLIEDVIPAFLESPLLAGSVRAQSLQELIHLYQGEYFGFALEAILPETIVAELVENLPVKVRKDERKWPNKIRYEIRLQVFNVTELHVAEEFLNILPKDSSEPEGGWGISDERPRSWFNIIARSGGRPSTIKTEYKRNKFDLRLQPYQLALANLPHDSNLFPATVWFSELIESGLMRYEPNWAALRRACPPGQPRTIRPDAANLPWLVLNMKRTQEDEFIAWQDHVRMAIPTLVDIDAIEREEDHHAYLKLKYYGDYTVTSSGLSDGTLRILALTVLPYLSNIPSAVFHEEPENGIHPQAIELVLQSLRSFQDTQVWLSTHSPIVLANTVLKDVIVMRKEVNGGVEAIAGDMHPRLRDWKQDVDLGTLFADGVLDV